MDTTSQSLSLDRMSSHKVPDGSQLSAFLTHPVFMIETLLIADSQ